MGVLQLPFFLLFGYLLQRFISVELQERMVRYLNAFIIYISLPSLVLVYMLDLVFENKFILPIASIWGLFFFFTAFVLWIAHKLNWTHSLTGAMLMLVPFGNTSFLGIPFTQAYFGKEGIPYAIVCDQLGSFLILSTVGIVLLSYFSKQEASVGRIVKRVLSFPAFLALIFVFFFDSNIFASWFMTILEFLASTLTPLALLSIGLFLKLKLDKEKLLAFSIALGLKLFAVPLLILGIFYFFNVDGLVAEVIVFESGMAPMVSSSLLAISVGLEKRFVASVLGYGILLSFVTLPILYEIIGLLL